MPITLPDLTHPTQAQNHTSTKWGFKISQWGFKISQFMGQSKVSLFIAVLTGGVKAPSSLFFPTDSSRESWEFPNPALSSHITHSISGSRASGTAPARFARIARMAWEILHRLLKHYNNSNRCSVGHFILL